MDDYFYSYNNASYAAPWFPYSEQLISVEIQEGVTDVGDYAFCVNTNLTEILLPESVTTIESFVFSDCQPNCKGKPCDMVCDKTFIASFL